MAWASTLLPGVPLFPFYTPPPSPRISESCSLFSNVFREYQKGTTDSNGLKRRTSKRSVTRICSTVLVILNVLMTSSGEKSPF